MKRHNLIIVALGLALAAGCKKDEKKDEAPAAAKGTGSAVASGTGTGTGTASGTGTGTAVAAAADAGTTAPPTPTGDVTLSYVPPKVGSKTHKEEQETADINFGGTPVKLVKSQVRHTEVLEAGEFATKVKTHYEKHTEVVDAEGKSNTKAEPVEGKTYLVWKDGDKVVATYEDGGAISPDELEEISESFDDELGRRPGIAEVLLRHTWKTGQAVALEGQDLVDLTEDMKKGAKVDAATFTLRSVDGTTAIWDMDIKLTTSGDVEGKTNGKIAMTIDTANVRPVAIEGDLEIDVKAKGTPMTGKSHTATKFTYQ